MATVDMMVISGRILRQRTGGGALWCSEEASAGLSPVPGVQVMGIGSVQVESRLAAQPRRLLASR
jgi:pyruvate kinase